jgi:hypothetical protein
MHSAKNYFIEDIQLSKSSGKRPGMPYAALRADKKILIG